MQHHSNLQTQEENSCFLPNLEINKSLFDKIKFENGKPDLISIILFSEISFCYQLSLHMIKDDQENTLLNKSYLEFSEEFSLTKRQVAESIARLEFLGVIERQITKLQVGHKTIPNTVLIKLTEKGQSLLTGLGVYPQMSLSESSQKRPRPFISNENTIPFLDITFERDIPFKRDTPFERNPDIYIDNINNIYKQTNKQARTFSFEKDLNEEGKEEINLNSLNPTPLELFPFEDEKEKWESWAKEELSWDPKTVFSEIKRFFNYHTKRQSLFLDWFSAWKKWCEMSFNRFKKFFPKISPGDEKRDENPKDDGFEIPEKNGIQTPLESVKDEIREKLKKFDIVGTKAETVLEKFGASVILKNIAYVTVKMEGGKEIQNKSGYLLKALYEDYAKDFEDSSGGTLETIKTPSMILQEEEEIESEIEGGEGSEIVKKIRKLLLKTFGSSAYKAWLNVVKVELKEKDLILKAASPFMRDWIENNMKRDIEKVLRSFFPEIDQVQFGSC
ncbi:MAG TPA: DnaA N-terminal domain-containing protein [Alphaproteobacteria bacterium]|nr:DnaA N-terminal domain-containing protein [Alphaproteobacteria bacterium]HQS93573.1 DnaA N-terminal domain-containing protein [Alphaproteobacteria bacterium]